MKKMITLVLFLTVSAFMFAQNNVTFQVNMGKQITLGNFTPGTDTLFVSGGFNDWGTANPIPAPAGGDSVFSVTINNIGSTGVNFEYKFRFLRGTTEVWEDIPNRTMQVMGGNQTLDVVYFNNNDWSPTVEVQMLFTCNMELEKLSGRFNPLTDTVSVNGNFNGWSSLVDLLEPGLDPNEYSGIVTKEVAVGEELAFKFWYTPNNWESVPNRMYTITQENVTAGFFEVVNAAYNNGSLSTVLNQPCTIKLTVNTIGAIDPNGVPFPSVSNVIVAGSSAPFAWPQGGWPTSDSALVVRLFDDGTNGDMVAGDGIFTKDVVFPAYTTLGVEYKYGINFGLPTNGGSNDNEGGVGANHTFPWAINYMSATAVDTFGIIKPANLINVVTGINELGGTPETFELSQNYPNPFNPSTSINFSVPSTGLVNLVVYNLIGQEVAVLVNEEKVAGNYQVSFDASKLPSGVYLYKISTSSFTATKKMMLLK